MKEATRKFLARKKRINAKIKASYPAFRIVVEKSNMYVRAQVLDEHGNVLCFVSDKGQKGVTKKERAQQAGEVLAGLMKKHAIEKATFDRNGNIYHWRVQALAEWIKAGGITI